MSAAELHKTFRGAVKCLSRRQITCRSDRTHHPSIGGRTLPMRLSPGGLTSPHRNFSSQPGRAAEEYGSITAAAPINFDSMDSGNSGFGSITKESLKRFRVVPASPSYFTGMPDFTDNLLSLRAILRKYMTLPTVRPIDAPRVAWRTLPEYSARVAEPVRASKYKKLVNVLQRLNRIHPDLMPDEVQEAMAHYKRDINPFANKPVPETIDEFGRAKGFGKRKSASCMVFLVEGEGEVLVNGRTLHTAFARVHDRESVVWALKTTERLDKYNVFATVHGGGTTGQAEALTLGVAKALMVHEPDLKPMLRRAGCITRDPRRVERKKPGHVKARKMPAWVKR